MNQEQVNSLLRTIMSLAGAFLISGGVNFFGNVIDTAYWQEISGIILTIVSIVWSIRSKTVDIEKMQGMVRQVITFICGILLAKGLLNESTVSAVIAFVGAILPFIQAALARKKAAALAVGEIKVDDLKGAIK